jgi:hypothetical protein
MLRGGTEEVAFFLPLTSCWCPGVVTAGPLTMLRGGTECCIDEFQHISELKKLPG